MGTGGGCIGGEIDNALRLSEEALAIKQTVFSENHYSITETNYCTAALYFLKGSISDCIRHLNIAINIFSLNVATNHFALEKIQEFSEKNIIKVHKIYLNKSPS